MNKTQNSGSAKNTVINLLITLAFAAVYFYVVLPPINLQSMAMYRFAFLVAAVFCGLTVLTAVAKIGTTDEKVDFVGIIKTNCLIPATICGVLVVFMLIGWVLSSPIIRAKAYSEMLEVKEGVFTDDID